MSRNSLGAAVCAVLLLLSACGGRSPNPVAQFQPGDEERSCSGLSIEISNNEEEIVRLLPAEDATGKNAVLGVTGAFLIVPLFFMDFKDAESIEIQALRRRNNWLRQVADRKGCDVPPSRFLTEGRPCSEAKDPSRPWIGRWAVTEGKDVLAVELTEYQVNGQLTTPDGTFQVDGRIDDKGIVEAKISSSWATGTLQGMFPVLKARAQGDAKMGGVSSSSDTVFTLCR